ncbi:MAG: hypothetical protein U1E16_04870 [Hyphomicrobiales bacterium]
MLLDWLIMKEPLDARKVLGTAIAILGVAIVIGLPEQAPGLVPRHDHRQRLLLVAGPGAGA